MSFEIRLATSVDAVAACAVLRRSIEQCCVLDHKNDAATLEAWLGNKTPEMVATWFASPTNFAQVAVEDGNVVGVALLTRAGKLALCYLLPQALGRGMGKALLAQMEAQAKEWGIKAVQLHSTAGAVAFYASQGYTQAGNVRSQYGVDTVFLWKALDESAQPADGKRKRFCNCNSAT